MIQIEDDAFKYIWHIKSYCVPEKENRNYFKNIMSPKVILINCYYFQVIQFRWKQNTWIILSKLMIEMALLNY